MLGRGLRFLGEGVKHVYSFRKAGGVNYTVSSRVVPYPDLLHALANRRHGLEIVGPLSTLHLVKLVAGILLCVLWEVAQAFKRVAKESHWFYD